jgi:flagellar protein FlaG
MKVELFKNLAIEAIKPPEAQNPTQTSLRSKETQAQQMDRREKEKIKKVDLEEIAQALQKFLEKFNLETKVVFEKEYNTLVVKVYERETGKLIRQIPPEELLEVSKRLQELVGILYRNKA